MIEVIDRISTCPGRVKLIPVPGQENTYDMIRADDPIEVGTPINKALFESIRRDLTALHQNVANIINAHASLTEIGGLPIGSEIGIYESGILVPYIKVGGDYNGTGRNVVIRKHIYKNDSLSTSAQGTKYANGKTDTWLNNEFYNLLDSRVREAIATVTINVSQENGGGSMYTLDRKVFLASVTEYGIVDSRFNVEGTAFPYFNSDARRVALLDGSAIYYWSRSPSKSTTNHMGTITSEGTSATHSASTAFRGIRPVFTLPHDFEVDVSGMSASNVMATAEVL